MKHTYEFEYGRIRIGPLLREDAEKLRILRNRNSSNFFNSNAISKEEQKKWYESYLNDEQDYIFSVYLLPSRQWVGVVSIYHVDNYNKTAEFGRLLIDKENVTQRGLGVDATLAACRFGFDFLHLRMLYLEVMKNNVAAVKTYQKAKFAFSSKRQDEKGNTILYMTKLNE